MIRKETLYNTGLLRDDSVSRIKQGLDPQGIASYAYIYMPPEALRSNPYFNSIQAPIKGLSPDYSTNSWLSDTCPCASNLYGTIGNQK